VVLVVVGVLPDVLVVVRVPVLDVLVEDDVDVDWEVVVVDDVVVDDEDVVVVPVKSSGCIQTTTF